MGLSVGGSDINVMPPMLLRRAATLDFSRALKPCHYPNFCTKRVC